MVVMVAHFNQLSLHLSQGTKNHEMPRQGQSVSGSSFELGTSRVLITRYAAISCSYSKGVRFKSRLKDPTSSKRFSTIFLSCNGRNVESTLNYVTMDSFCIFHYTLFNNYSTVASVV
jgi:hypothetical protein